MGINPADHDRSSLALEPGRIVGLDGAPGSGLTRLGLSLLAPLAGPVAIVDARGWFCPVAGWESGLDPGRMVVVRCGDRDQWSQVMAALVEGVRAVYAEVPPGVPEPMLRRLGALVRSRRTALVLRPLRGPLPSGAVHLRLRAHLISWEGPDAGHGRLQHRRIVVEASGKGMGGMTRFMEVEDDGTHPVRVVSRLAAAARAAG